MRPVLNEAYELERLEVTSPERVDYSNTWLINGPSGLAEINIDPEFGVMPTSDQLLIAIICTLWQYPAPMYTSQKRQAEQDLGRTFFVSGERGMPEDLALTTDTLSLHSSFPKGNRVARDVLASLGEAIERLLPVILVERINLVTDDIIDRIEYRIDPAIVEWCNSGAERWIAITREGRDSPWIGVRAASSD